VRKHRRTLHAAEEREREMRSSAAFSHRLELRPPSAVFAPVKGSKLAYCSLCQFHILETRRQPAIRRS
jgi:hypothetical protein